MQIAPATVVRRRVLHVAIAAAIATSSTACAGSDNRDGPTSGDGRPAATVTPRRERWFDPRERAAVEAAVSGYDESLSRLTTGAERCNREAAERSEAGQPPAVQVRCHVTSTRALVRDVARIRSTVDGLDRGHRSECERARRSLAAFTTTYEAAWQRVLDDWLAYSRGDRGRDDDVVPDTERASRLASEFTDDRLAALGTECFDDRARGVR